jgi:hypothetical protein
VNELEALSFGSRGAFWLLSGIVWAECTRELSEARGEDS